VNDPFVLAAWEEKSGGRENVLFLSDGNAEFTKKIGMDFDGSGFGLGTRSKRYSALVQDGVVKILNVEESPAVAEASTALTDGRMRPTMKARLRDSTRRATSPGFARTRGGRSRATRRPTPGRPGRSARRSP